VSAQPWHGWQSVSPAYGAQIGSDRQRCGELGELHDECEGRALIDIVITSSTGWFTKAVVDFWMPNGKRQEHHIRWFFRDQTAWDWAEGVATRMEKQYG